MRKRRAILFDDDPAVLGVLTSIFETRGYEVLACREPVGCPVYTERERCDKERPCGDLVITDLSMPQMTGLEMLALQARRGCRLDIRNKAVLSGNLSATALEEIRSLGCAGFRKPFRLGELTAWIEECEARMDLSRPLGVRRREPREPCGGGAVFSVESEKGLCVAQVVNKSDSGLCVRLDSPLAETQVLSLKSPLELSSDRLEVRWTRPMGPGGCLAGLSCR